MARQHGGPPKEHLRRERLKWPIVRTGYRLGLDIPRPRVPTSLTGFTQTVKQMGWQPETCVDVGVGWGTTELQDGFPQARHVLIEPNPLFADYLQRWSAEKGWSFHQKALSDRPGTVPFAAHEDHQSGRITEDESSGTVIEVEATTLDEIDLIDPLGDDFLLKIDVEGHEGEVLAGATKTLPRAEVVIIETRPAGPTTSSEIVAEMLQHEHYLAGFITPWVEAADWRRLRMVDLVFIRGDSPLRGPRPPR